MSAKDHSPSAEEKTDEGGVALVVDDEDSVRGIVIRFLEGAGYAVAHAASVASARHLLNTCQISLAVLDIKLPDGSGLDIAELLVNGPTECPMVIMSGEHGAQLWTRPSVCNCCEFIAKPFRRAQFLAAVQRAKEAVERQRQR